MLKMLNYEYLSYNSSEWKSQQNIHNDHENSIQSLHMYIGVLVAIWEWVINWNGKYARDAIKSRHNHKHIMECHMSFRR